MESTSLASRVYRGHVQAENVYPTPGAKEAYGRPRDPLPNPSEPVRESDREDRRGLTYVMTGQFIEPPHYVKFYPDGPDTE